MKLMRFFLLMLSIILVILLYDLFHFLWVLTPWSLYCDAQRPSSNYNHHVCIGSTVVTKTSNHNGRWKTLYTDKQLASTYHDCPSTAISTPFLVARGVAYYKRIDHHEVTPKWDENRAALIALDRCAREAGDCFSDLMSKNLHLDASGHIVIIDATIAPCFVFGDVVSSSSGMTNLLGSELEEFYVQK